MPQPGDLVPHPDGPPAVRMVDPDQCGDCGEPWRGEGWWRTFSQCTCTPGKGGHWTWSHSCGWELTVPPHKDEQWDQPYV